MGKALRVYGKFNDNDDDDDADRDYNADNNHGDDPYLFRL